MDVYFCKAVATHVLKWLTNLNRAKKERKHQSLKAVNKAVSLIRKTTAYSRGLRKGRQDFGLEAALAEDWSDLAYELTSLKLIGLAKKCDITGRYWADSTQFTHEFIMQADIGFQAIEKLARDLSVKIQLGSKL